MTERQHKLRVCSSTFPILFWRKCIKCKKEFSREWLWYYGYLAGWDDSPSYCYVCKNCAKSNEEASQLIHDYLYKSQDSRRLNVRSVGRVGSKSQKMIIDFNPNLAQQIIILDRDTVSGSWVFSAGRCLRQFYMGIAVDINITAVGIKSHLGNKTCWSSAQIN